MKEQGFKYEFDETDHLAKHMQAEYNLYRAYLSGVLEFHHFLTFHYILLSDSLLCNYTRKKCVLATMRLFCYYFGTVNANNVCYYQIIMQYNNICEFFPTNAAYPVVRKQKGVFCDERIHPIYQWNMVPFY